MLFVLNFKKEKKVNAQFPDHLNDQELLEIVKAYQIHTHSRTCWKYKKNECRLSFRRYFTKKAIAKPFHIKISNEEKQEILTWRNTLIS